MISRGAYNWNEGLSNACWNGNYVLMKMMISLGADAILVGLRNVCTNVYKSLVQLMICYGACDWDDGYAAAEDLAVNNISRMMMVMDADMNLLLTQSRFDDSMDRS